MAFSTSVSLLTVKGLSYTPRSVSYTAPSLLTTTLSSPQTSHGIVFQTTGGIYTRTAGTPNPVDGSWANPISNPLNPEGYSFRYVYVSGYSIAGSVPANGVWQDCSSVMVVEMNSIPATSGSYSSTFTFEVRNSSLTTILSTNITITANR